MRKETFPAALTAQTKEAKVQVAATDKGFHHIPDSTVEGTVRPVEALVPDAEEFLHGILDDVFEVVGWAAGSVARGGKCRQDVVGPLPGSRAESAGSRAGWGGPGRVGHKAEAGEGSLSRVSDHVEQESEAFRARRDRSLDLLKV